MVQYNDEGMMMMVMTMVVMMMMRYTVQKTKYTKCHKLAKLDLDESSSEQWPKGPKEGVATLTVSDICEWTSSKSSQ